MTVYPCIEWSFRPLAYRHLHKHNHPSFCNTYSCTEEEGGWERYLYITVSVSDGLWVGSRAAQHNHGGNLRISPCAFTWQLNFGENFLTEDLFKTISELVMPRLMCYYLELQPSEWITAKVQTRANHQISNILGLRNVISWPAINTLYHLGVFCSASCKLWDMCIINLIHY